MVPPPYVLPEVQRALEGFGVAESSFNKLAEAGLTTFDALLETNDMMLRSLGIRKGARVKILHWVCTKKCSFQFLVYSRGYVVGTPEAFS